MFARELTNLLSPIVPCMVQDIRELDVETMIPSNDGPSPLSQQVLYVFVLATYTEGTPTESAKWFYQWLEDVRYDFRVSKTALAKMNYAVFGLGHSEYQENFNAVAKKVDLWLHGLGGNRVLRLGLGDQKEGMQGCRMDG